MMLDARHISTRSVARLLRHGRRVVRSCLPAGLRCPFTERQRGHSGRDASYRAIDTLTAMTGIFVICAFALMGGQDHRALGIEWLVVAAISIAVYLHGYVQAVRRGGSIGLASQKE